MITNVTLLISCFKKSIFREKYLFNMKEFLCFNIGVQNTNSLPKHNGKPRALGKVCNLTCDLCLKEDLVYFLLLCPCLNFLLGYYAIRNWKKNSDFMDLNKYIVSVLWFVAFREIVCLFLGDFSDENVGALFDRVCKDVFC